MLQILDSGYNSLLTMITWLDVIVGALRESSVYHHILGKRESYIKTSRFSNLTDKKHQIGDNKIVS